MIAKQGKNMPHMRKNGVSRSAGTLVRLMWGRKGLKHIGLHVAGKQHIEIAVAQAHFRKISQPPIAPTRQVD